MNWLLGRKSQLTLVNKLLVHKTILIPGLKGPSYEDAVH